MIALDLLAALLVVLAAHRFYQGDPLVTAGAAGLMWLLVRRIRADEKRAPVVVPEGEP